MINTSNWEEFRVGDLFTLERGKCSKVAGLSTGDIPYVGCTNRNNGILGYYAFDADLISKGNCIVFIGNGNGSAGQQIYKEEDFVSSTGNVIGYRDGLNKYNAGFVVSVMDKIQEVTQKFSHANGRTLDKLSEQIIKLPATLDGQPDWDYMESYMKAVMEESEASIENLRSTDDYRHKIDISNWKEFRVGDLFRIEPAKGKNQQQLDDGDDVPYIAASKENNGFNRMVSMKGHEDWVSKGNCLQFIHIGDAAAGHVNYIPDDFIGMSGKSSCAYNDNINEYTGLFLAGIITYTNEGKYSFKDSWTGAKVQNTVIKLPATPDGSPDWDYMERYMRDIMTEAEQNVLTLNM